MITNRRRANQRGSALLIVLVFAAMLAIMLYQEMPVATFEAQRQKEELLIDRGNEYEHAIKLYVRKLQTFPPSIDALENTNRMRFLRSRYVDPYTGKDDWRLLHAGPGGTIIDSKIKQNTPVPNGAAGSNSNGFSSTPVGAPSSVTNPFANSFDGSNPTSTGTVAPSFPQRPPAASTDLAAGGGSPDSQPTSTDPSQNPAQNGGQPGNPMSTSSFPFAGTPGRYRGGVSPTGDSYPPIAPPTDPQSAMQSLLNNQNPQPAPQNSGATTAPPTPSAFGSTPSTQPGSMGTTMGGGIAGVASKSAGHTIKTVKEQTDRSLWEFVYDMQKEAAANAPGLAGNGANGANPNGTQPAQPTSFGSSSFNQNNNAGTTTPPPPSPTNQ
jgi:hypothetical protein